ncbi:hypothetical protein POM88_003999 [Heracleum sosnowskyi]|uniref:DUF7950 domain-containing protein n=1 Tax=Heracleum sosnowskyi TaxID=360622 RepID=A0AAD8JHK1_9APIA|nr:hypothetical protein POM88_003999 [Heracleum sosnowskyi]
MDGGDRGGSQEKTIMNHIMLRFRPIAPKPVMNGSDSSCSDLMKKEVIGKKRTKRKYVRVNKNEKKNSEDKTLKKSDDENSWLDETHVKLTLELLPGSSVERGSRNLSDLRGVESWVSIECVTGGFGHGRRIGCTDVEKVRSLERDTCPGFVSDGDGGVRWVNLAYRRMVNGPEGGVGDDVVVWLINKERIPVGMEAFSCRLRVEYGGGRGRGKVVPCDVWRMDGELGLYAWRLDLEAALSLGR